MIWHEFLDDDLRDLAAQYVLGSLDSEEARRFRLHLPGCEVCRHEVGSLGVTAGRLTLAAPEIAPPAYLWDRIRERIRAGGTPPPGAPIGTKPASNASQVPNQVWKQWGRARDAAPSGLLFSSGATAAFEPTGIDGIEVRRLAADPVKEQVTMLVRMAAGTAYPAHRHGGAEECFVLQGDLHVGDVHMHDGDFQRSEGGTVHPVQRTDGGCLLLIVSSTTDELIDTE